MEVDVLVDKGGDEEVGVVVARLVAEIEALAHGVARRAERLGLELVDVADEEVVVGALGDEDVAEGEGPALAHELRRVVRRAGFDGAQVALEGFFAPGNPSLFGLQMGEKADTDVQVSGAFMAIVSAPAPPMLWPVIDRLPTSTAGAASRTAATSSSVT